MKNWMDLYHQGGIIHSQTGEFEIFPESRYRIVAVLSDHEHLAHEMHLLCHNRRYNCSHNSIT